MHCTAISLFQQGLEGPDHGKGTAPIDLEYFINPLIGQAMKVIMGDWICNTRVVNQKIYFSISFGNPVRQVLAGRAVGDRNLHYHMTVSNQA